MSLLTYPGVEQCLSKDIPEQKDVISNYSRKHEYPKQNVIMYTFQNRMMSFLTNPECDPETECYYLHVPEHHDVICKWFTIKLCQY